MGGSGKIGGKFFKFLHKNARFFNISYWFFSIFALFFATFTQFFNAYFPSASLRALRAGGSFDGFGPRRKSLRDYLFLTYFGR